MQKRKCNNTIKIENDIVIESKNVHSCTQLTVNELKKIYVKNEILRLAQTTCMTSHDILCKVSKNTDQAEREILP